MGAGQTFGGTLARTHLIAVRTSNGPSLVLISDETAVMKQFEHCKVQTSLSCSRAEHLILHPLGALGGGLSLPFAAGVGAAKAADKSLRI